MPSSGTWKQRRSSWSSLISQLGESADKRFVEWDTLFQQALGYDKRNEYYVAISIYERLIANMEAFLENIKSDYHERLSFTDEQVDAASDAVFCLNCRVSHLQNPNVNKWLTYDEISKLKPVLKDFHRWNRIFPILIQAERPNSVASVDGNEANFQRKVINDENSSLLPPLPKKRGFTRLSITLKKIGLKDAPSLANPCIRISVRDKDSVNLTDYMYTPYSSKIQNFHIEFDSIVNVQQYIERIPNGSSIFFELRYEKGEKQKVKCWAVLRKPDFKNLKGYLELYKPPADFHLKRCEKLSSKKPLYLHLDVGLLD